VKILIELPTWLGDAAMVTPAIENILKHFNGAEISLIGSFASTELLKNHPKVTEVNILDKKYLSLFRLSKDLGRFDNYFSFRGSIRSKVFKFLISSDYKYQFEKEMYKGLHQVEKYNSFINDSLKVNFKPGKLLINNAVRSAVKESTRIVGINPGASYGSSKRWYPEKFAELAIELSSQFEILIFGGPDETDIALDIENYLIKKGVVNYKNLSGKTKISELVEHISKLDLFISGDSGPMHIAASFQIPTIAIFGPTHDIETSQWMNQKSVIVKKNLDCQPCMKRNCPLLHHNCMKTIEVDDVLNAVKTIL
jgi:heptosyltransferase II